MIDPRLHQQFNTTVSDIRDLISRVSGSGREPNAEDAQQFASLAARAEELRRACLPVPQLDLSQTA